MTSIRDTKKCPDCQGELEEGGIIDNTSGANLVAKYGKAVIPAGRYKMAWMQEADFRDIRRIVAYRCTKCNRLYQYAQEDVLWKNIRSAYSSNAFQGMMIFAIVMVVGLAILGFIGQ